ncbi:MAG TPA: cobalt-precorrin-6A reductase [Candidatus Baltobacteraceae bacterium]|jgi:precorrin-6A/cobalt-precorrin-6A reductase|nr:cobalt-precorrin-6A reductase [Candidatus Baltobacteraceae bacterium]
MNSPLRLLILGGTGDARQLAHRLSDISGIVAISSLAGRVAQPTLPNGPVRVGGFGEVAGLVTYLRNERIDAVVDATHPFAANISRNAADACGELALPLIALLRPPWKAGDGDHWHDADDLVEAAEIAENLGRRIFLTIGRQGIAAFADCRKGWFLIRSIDKPDPPLPSQHEILLQRGPFEVDEEIRVMRKHAIDVIVSKNSGGSATFAKIEAARVLGLPVVMIKRPRHPRVPAVKSVDSAFAWIEQVRKLRCLLETGS